MSIFKNRSKGFAIACTAACLAVVGLIAYFIGIADANSTTNELISYVVIGVCAAVAIEVLCAFLPRLAGLRALVPVGYAFAFMSIAYSIVFYVVNVSAKMYAYLSQWKVVSIVCIGVAMILGAISAFMSDTRQS